MYLSGESGIESAQELREVGYEGVIVGMSAEPKALDDKPAFDRTL